LRLHCDRDDAFSALIPHHTTAAGTELVMRVTINKDAKELLGATDVVSGQVVSYAFKIRGRSRAEEIGHVIAAQPGNKLISLDLERFASVRPRRGRRQRDRRGPAL
jgi:hypothetical protein